MENNFLPSESTIFEPRKDIRKNYFESEIFFDEIQPEKENKINKEKDSNNLLKELEDILQCCICYNYLENPVNDPSCCMHYACKSCLDQYFKQKRTLMVPCPLCRKYIKKKNLIRIPIFDSIKEILKDAKNSKNIIQEKEKIDENCKAHPKNAIFSLCLDCKIKMCPICKEEEKKHENHHVVNYARYVELFNFFHENFQEIKSTISDKEYKIKEFNELLGKLEQQKNAYLNFLEDISHQIKKIYTNNQEKINKEIGKSMETIAKLRNFMINIKSQVSSQFKASYNDLENIDEIKSKIKERTEQLKTSLDEMKKNDLNIIKNSIKNLNGIKKEKHLLSIDKKLLLESENIYTHLDKFKNISFGVEISKKDNKLVTMYLDIKKIINNIQNDSSYMAFIELNNKIIYLEPFEISKDLYSYEFNLPIVELFTEKEEKKEVKLTILSLNLE